MNMLFGMLIMIVGILFITFGLYSLFKSFKMSKRKIVFLTRALPNTGKSTLCETLFGEKNTCTADEYFYILAKQQGLTYRDVWSFEKLGEAHNFCKQKFISLIKNGADKIAVANTNVREADVKYYQKIAEENGYLFFSVVLENRKECGDNGHNVPLETILSMENTLKGNIKLR